jgi:hypothetical protein
VPAAGTEAARVAAGTRYGLISDTPGIYFHPCLIGADVDEPVPQRIDEAHIRSIFGGTIFPPAVVAIEPMGEQVARESVSKSSRIPAEAN